MKTCLKLQNCDIQVFKVNLCFYFDASCFSSCQFYFVSFTKTTLGLMIGSFFFSYFVRHGLVDFFSWYLVRLAFCLFYFDLSALAALLKLVLPLLRWSLL